LLMTSIIHIKYTPEKMINDHNNSIFLNILLLVIIIYSSMNYWIKICKFAACAGIDTKLLRIL